MRPKQLSKILFSIVSCCSTFIFADINNDSCMGPLALLAIVDRPTVGDSACTVGNKNGVLELGIQFQKIYPVSGFQYNLPQSELRLGLPQHTEFVVLLPNYIHQSIIPHTGITSTIIGIKHRVSSTEKLQTAVESLITLPTGNNNFGSQGLGLALNGITSYNITSNLNFTFMFGVSTQAQSKNAGGAHSTSLNPDAVITWSVNGQSKTAPGVGSGFNSDTGIIYLLLPNMTVDAEFGQRISGVLGGLNHYIGAGLAIAF
jgi:hypothetical protein